MFSFQEDLLHYIWRLQYYNTLDLRTSRGEKIVILNPGTHNHDSGPDFDSAKIILQETTWVGNLEIHIKSSDWVKHHHHNDEAYDNVILHVVYEEDEIILREDGSEIPCLELKGLIKEEVFSRYFYLQSSQAWIPCQRLIKNVPPIIKSVWLESVAISRLEQKSASIQELLEHSNYDWEQSFFIHLGKCFGSRINIHPFEMLCKKIDLKNINKNKDNKLIVDSFFFGQAGMLNYNFKDTYPQSLKKEYQYLKHKYNLEEIPMKLWKFFRLRPSNFPTLRIAQLAGFFRNNVNVFSQILEIEDISTFNIFIDSEINDYWDKHYIFDKESTLKSKKIGTSFKHSLLINGVIPFIFIFGKCRNEDKYIERALDLLSAIPPENNKVIKNWKDLGFTLHNACESQGLLHLKKHYCEKNKCLECSIGHQIMKEERIKYGKALSE